MPGGVVNVVVTGGSGTIGGAVVQSLIALGCHIVIAGRDGVAVSAAASHFSSLFPAKTSGGWAKGLALDVNSAASVRAFVADLDAVFPEGIDTLVNNAAVVSDTLVFTGDGHELQWSTNTLGYFSVMSALLPALERGAQQPGRVASRIVNVASDFAGDLALDDLDWTRRKYSSHLAYRQSKAADRMLSAAAAAALAASAAAGAPPIAVHACHPGVIGSKVYNGLMGGTIVAKWRDALRNGLDVQVVALATSREASRAAELAGSGRYWARVQPKACRFASDAERTRRTELVTTLAAQHIARFGAPPHPRLLGAADRREL
jgi:NAD(P)-dependent dehydrogenase (short-subunit alcohol dehydrogenase family)